MAAVSVKRFIDHSRKYHSIPQCCSFVTPKFCISIVFSFSWCHFNSQEKLKTTLMQTFGVTNKEYYGMLWYFVELSMLVHYSFLVYFTCCEAHLIMHHGKLRCISFKCNRSLLLVCFVYAIKVTGGLDPLSFHKLCVHMHVSKTKFERSSSLEFYHMTRIGKTKHTS